LHSALDAEEKAQRYHRELVDKTTGPALAVVRYGRRQSESTEATA